jgi:uncharacterized membrane protein YgaE (UPF0421/DUF939 family)
VKTVGNCAAVTVGAPEKASLRPTTVRADCLSAAAFAIRCAVAATLACQLSNLLGLDEPVWGVISALIASQVRLDDTQSSSQDRVFGSVLGIAISLAVHAAACVVAAPRVLQIAVAVGVCAAITRKLPGFRVAMWTCPIVLLASTSSALVTTAAIDRGSEIFLGVVVGFALHWLAERIAPRCFRH